MSRHRTRKFVYAEPTLCSGCASCVSVCSLVHTGEINPQSANIAISCIEPAGFHEALVHCDGSPCDYAPQCLMVCATGALMWGTVDEILALKKRLALARQKTFNSAKVRAPWTLEPQTDEAQTARMLAAGQQADEPQTDGKR